MSISFGSVFDMKIWSYIRDFSRSVSFIVSATFIHQLDQVMEDTRSRSEYAPAGTEIIRMVFQLVGWVLWGNPSRFERLKLSFFLDVTIRWSETKVARYIKLQSRCFWNPKVVGAPTTLIQEAAIGPNDFTPESEHFFHGCSWLQGTGCNPKV